MVGLTPLPCPAAGPTVGRTALKDDAGRPRLPSRTHPDDPFDGTTLNRQLLAIPAVALMLLAASCGFFKDAGPKTTQDRTIQGATAVQLLTSGDLTVTVGQQEALSVTAGANQLVGLTSQVIDGTLILDNKSTDTYTGDISYALTVPPLVGVQLSGSGSVTGVGVLTGDAQVTGSGSGAATLTGLALSSVVVDLSGSGDVQLAGQARTSRVTLTGSGRYDGSALVTEQTDIDTSGSGEASVNVTARLGATASGSGTITYTGNPLDVTKQSSGSGGIAPG